MPPKKAIQQTVNTLENVSVVMNMQADGATQILAEALLAQAKANRATSEAMQKLAGTLKPIYVCAIKVSNSGIDI